MKYHDFETKIRALVAADELKKAIDLLVTYFEDNPKLDEIIIKSGNYNALKKDQRLNIVSHEEVQRNFNKLRLSILEFVRLEKENQILQKNTSERQNKRYDSLFKHSLARLCVLCILKTEAIQDGLTIKKIQEKSKTKSRMWIVKSIHEMVEYGLVERLEPGKFVHWRLTKKGLVLAEQMKDSLLFEKLI